MTQYFYDKAANQYDNNNATTAKEAFTFPM